GQVRRRAEAGPRLLLEPRQHLPDGPFHIARLGDENLVAESREAGGLHRIDHDHDGGTAARLQAAYGPQTHGVLAENDGPASPTLHVSHSTPGTGSLARPARAGRDHCLSDSRRTL